MSTDTAAVFVGFRYVVRANSDQTAITDFEFPVELHQSFGLAAILGAETSAAEDKNHGMLALEFGELPVLPSMVGEFVIRKHGARNDVSSHGETPPQIWMRAARLRLIQ